MTTRETCAYLVSGSRSASWPDAKTECEKMGGKLASPRSLEEEKAIEDLNLGQTWFGLTDVQNEGTWRDVNGHVSPYIGTWGAGQPDNYNNGENCAHMYPSNGNFFWNDHRCSTKYNFTCGKKHMLNDGHASTNRPTFMWALPVYQFYLSATYHTIVITFRS